MSPEAFVLLSGTLTFGMPCALAVRELIVLRRPDRGSWGRKTPPPDPAPKPLPDCLIPKLGPPPVRSPERALELV